jgi:hypothetical protein
VSWTKRKDEAVDVIDMVYSVDCLMDEQRLEISSKMDKVYEE